MRLLYTKPECEILQAGLFVSLLSKSQDDLDDDEEPEDTSWIGAKEADASFDTDLWEDTPDGDSY